MSVDDFEHALREAMLSRPAVGESGSPERELADSHLLVSRLSGMAPEQCGQGRRAPLQGQTEETMATQPTTQMPNSQASFERRQETMLIEGDVRWLPAPEQLPIEMVKYLPQYNPLERCSKCGSSDPSVLLRVSWPLLIRNGKKKERNLYDYLELTCTRCRNTWARTPLDREPEVSA